MLRQQGRCFDCGTRMILGKIVFDHRPSLALRDKGDNANDPDRLVAICTVCDRRKTPRDIKDIARAKRLALKQQDFDERMRDKVPGRAVPSRSQWRKLVRSIGNGLPVHRFEDIAVIESSQMWTCRKASVCRS